MNKMAKNEKPEEFAVESGNYVRRLQNRLQMLAVSGLLIAGVAVFLATAIPMYGKLHTNAEAALSNELDLKRLAVSQYFQSLGDIGLQVTSRSRIRQELARFNKREISLAELRDFTTPKLDDALNLNDQMVGIVRMDRSNRVVSSVGTNIPLEKAEYLLAKKKGPGFSRPVSIHGKWHIVVSAPIISPNGEREGTDLLLFELQRLAVIATSEANPEKPFKTFFAVDDGLSPRFFNAIGENLRFTPFSPPFRLPDGATGFPSETDDGDFVVESAGIDGVQWSVWVFAETDLLFAQVKRAFVLPIAIMAYLVMFGGVAVWMLLLPISDRMLITTAALERQIEERTRDLKAEIADKERAECALDVERRRLQEIIWGTNAGTWEWDLQTGEVRLNERWAEIIGYTLDELEPTTMDSWRALTHPQDVEKSDERLRGVYIGNDYYECEIRMRHKKGHWVWVRDRGRVVERSPEGSPLRISGIHQDITERRTAETALRKSEAGLRSIMDSAPVAILFKDCEGRILAANQTHLERNGLILDDIKGKTTSTYSDDDTAKEVARQERLVTAARKPMTFEVRRRHPKGDERNLMVVRFPVLDQDSELMGLGAIAFDVTERSRMERQLAHAQKMHVVGQLTGGVAHDFNNLLQVIQTNLELAKLDLSNQDAVLDFLNTAVQAGRQGADLTQKLLAFSRKQTLRPESLNIRHWIEGLTKILSRTLGEDVEICVQVSDELPNVFVDENGLTTAMLNLAVNARAAMPKGGTLSITGSSVHLEQGRSIENDVLPPGDYVEIVVSDTGTGMSEEVRIQAFEPFFTTKGVGEGSGLGLSMVFGFVRQSGGNVTIKSVVGLGTTVLIWLPAARQERIGESETAVETVANASSLDINLLLVEDDASVRDSTRMLLESLGCVVHEVESAAAALEVLDNESAIDTLLTDMVLPGGMNGVELADEAARLYPNLNILLVSGYPETALQNAGLDNVRFPLLAKPFSVSALIDALQSMQEDRMEMA